MGRPKSMDPKTVVSARVNSRQLQLLKRYAELKGLSESEAICRMIDGVEAFLKKERALDFSTEPTVSAAVASHQSEPEHHIDESSEGEGDSGPSCPVVNGRTVIGLPGGGRDVDFDMSGDEEQPSIADD